MTNLSPEYLEAIATHDKAIKAYTEAAEIFRSASLRSPPAGLYLDFDTAQKAKVEAAAAFDLAFELEASRPRKTFSNRNTWR